MNWIDIGIVVVAIVVLVVIRQSVIFRAYCHIAGRPALADDEFAATYFPGPPGPIAVNVREMLALYLPTGVSRIQPQDRLVDDLGLSARLSRGMDLVAFVEDVEAEYKIEFTEDDYLRLQTFGDAVRLVGEKTGL